MLKIAYVGLKWNYGKREEGYSYEHNNIEAGLKDCVSRGMFECQFFHPDEAGEISSLREKTLGGLFDIIFHTEFNESLDLPEDISIAAINMGLKVLDWSCDASWRFHNFIVQRKHRYTHFITTHSSTIPLYQQNGMKVIKSQWGGSPLYYPDSSVEKIYDITFIGQKHGIRPQIVKALAERGIKVHLFGNYWDGYDNWHGYLTDFDSMLKVFRQSKICLNLSNPWHVGTLNQVKGRAFEIPQCGAFQISTPADNLHSYFEPNKEIVIANDIEELASKIKYYLSNDSERQAIAQAGHGRMLSEHEWYHRFEKIIKAIE